MQSHGRVSITTYFVTIDGITYIVSAIVTSCYTAGAATEKLHLNLLKRQLAAYFRVQALIHHS